MQLSLPFVAFFTFLGLRLAGATDWSWWWVTSPLWISAVLVGIFITVSLLVINHARKRIQAQKLPFKSWEQFVR